MTVLRFRASAAEGTHSATDNGRVMIRHARRLAMLRAYMDRLEAGDLPTRAEFLKVD